MLPPEVEERVQLDGALRAPEVRPREKRETEIDRRGIQRIYGLVQLHPEALARIQPAGLADQDPGEVGVDAPVALLVRHGQGVARDSRPDAHVVELLRAGTQAGFDVAQALPIAELGESQGEKVVPAGKAAHPGIAPVAAHTLVKLPMRRMGHHLGEERLPLIHGSLRFVKSRQSGTPRGRVQIVSPATSL